MINDNITP